MIALPKPPAPIVLPDAALEAIAALLVETHEKRLAEQGK